METISNIYSKLLSMHQLEPYLLIYSRQIPSTIPLAHTWEVWNWCRFFQLTLLLLFPPPLDLSQNWVTLFSKISQVPSTKSLETESSLRLSLISWYPSTDCSSTSITNTIWPKTPICFSPMSTKWLFKEGPSLKSCYKTVMLQSASQ